MIDLGLSGKRAVVSGAGYIPGRAGHGWFTSLALAEAGASVASVGINRTVVRLGGWYWLALLTGESA